MNYYTFGLKHKGYNDITTSNGNSTAQKFKFNGIEYEDNTGLYEMDVRSYDPAIARWTSIDPVTHHSMSPYTAFDNNPVVWADPSGADGESLGGAILGVNAFTEDVAMKAGFSKGGLTIIKSGTSGSSVKEETPVQKRFRKAITSMTNEVDRQNDGLLSKEASDEEVTAYQLFYQWVMGKGSDSRNFDENSTMGKEMLQAPEVIAAIKKAIAKANNGNFDGEGFARILKNENPIKYLESFYLDADGRNPARAFHGSFSGKVNVDLMYSGKGVSIINLSIIMTDKMTATSGTRSSPLGGGYGPNPVAIYPRENPYGPRGQFRTIKVNYNMIVNVQDGSVIKN